MRLACYFYVFRNVRNRIHEYKSDQRSYMEGLIITASRFFEKKLVSFKDGVV